MNIYAKDNTWIDSGVKYISVTTDMWTSNNVDSYMAFTVHFVHQSLWARKVVVLDCVPFPERHTAANIQKALQKVLDEYSLSEKLHLIVRDNGANVVKAMELGGFENVGCFLHATHLIVENSLSCQRSVIDMLAKVKPINPISA